MNIESGPLTKLAYELCLAIEKIGPSQEQTAAVILASELGNKIEAMETQRPTPPPEQP